MLQNIVYISFYISRPPGFLNLLSIQLYKNRVSMVYQKILALYLFKLLVYMVSVQINI